MQRLPLNRSFDVPPVLLPAIAASAALFFCVGVAAYFEGEVVDRRRVELHSKLRDTLQREGAELRSAVMTRAYLLRPLDALVATNPGVTQEQFLPFAGQALGRFPQVGVRSLQLAKDSKISHVFPGDLASERFGTDLSTELDQSAGISTAVRTHDFALSEPHYNDAGILTAFVHTPIFLPLDKSSDESYFWGFGSVEIDLTAMIEDAQSELHAARESTVEYALRIHGDVTTGDPSDVFFGPSEIFADGDNFESVEVQLPHQKWELAAIPTEAQPLAAILLLLLRANGLLVGALCARFVWTGMRRASLLGSLVRTSTEDLSRSRRRLALMMESSPVGLFETDADGGCTYVNPRWCELAGMTPDQAMGSGWIKAIHPDDIERVGNAWTRFADGGEGYHQECRYSGPDGEVNWIECTATRILDVDGEVTGFAGASLDITARLKAESERLELEARVLHSQKLESLGVLAGGIAHDFNNLLMGITGHSDLVLHELSETSETSAARKHMAEIAVSANRAAALCTQMLNYAGRGNFTMEAIDLNSIATEIPQLLSVSVTKSVNLLYELDEKLPPIQADSSQLRQILLNLVINASESIADQSSAERGAVSIRTGRRTLSSGDIALMRFNGGLVPGDSFYFEVEDNGTGMSEEVLSRIFEPFFTTKFTGRGLGMSAVLGIIGSHGGGIAVESTPDVGTRFTVYLPPSEMPVARPISVEQREQAWSGSGHILLIDDEEIVRKPAQLLLEHIGYTVTTAECGEDGLEALSVAQDAITLVVLDLTMPGIGGEECLRRIRMVSPELPVLLISGYSGGTWLRKVAGQARTAFLAKPFGHAELREALKDLSRQLARENVQT